MTKQIFSRTHSLVAPVSQALVAPKGVNGKSLEGTKIVQHPVGTVLKFEDDEADSLIDRGTAVEYSGDGAVDGVVPVVVPQAASTLPLPEGFTRPGVVRIDESLNEPAKGTAASPIVLGDTRDAASRQATLDAQAAANAATVVVPVAK